MKFKLYLIIFYFMNLANINNSVLAQTSQETTIIDWTPQTGTICYRFRKDGTRFIYKPSENPHHICNTGKEISWVPLFPTERNSQNGESRAVIRTYPQGPILCVITEGEIHVLEYKLNNWHMTDQCGYQVGVIHTYELNVGDSELAPDVLGYCFYRDKLIPDYYCP